MEERAEQNSGALTDTSPYWDPFSPALSPFKGGNTFGCHLNFGAFLGKCLPRPAADSRAECSSCSF